MDKGILKKNSGYPAGSPTLRERLRRTGTLRERLPCGKGFAQRRTGVRNHDGNRPPGSPVPLPLREAASRLRDGNRPSGSPLCHRAGNRQDGKWTHQDGGWSHQDRRRSVSGSAATPSPLRVYVTGTGATPLSRFADLKEVASKTASGLTKTGAGLTKTASGLTALAHH